MAVAVGGAGRDELPGQQRRRLQLDESFKNRPDPLRVRFMDDELAVADLIAERGPTVHPHAFLPGGGYLVADKMAVRAFDGAVLMGDAGIVARRRHAVMAAELIVAARQVRSAPYPSSHAKQQMRAQIEALAMQGAPSVSNLIEHDRQIEWPTQMLRSDVRNTPQQSRSQKCLMCFRSSHGYSKMS